ncbi:hypothetical protein [Streptomyces sp. NPDC001070]
MAERTDDGQGATWIVTQPFRDNRNPAVASLRVTVNAAGRLLGVRLAAAAGSGSAEESGGCP